MNRPRIRQALAALMLYIALAVASTWPLASNLGDDNLALGTEAEATVPLASAWALWWTSESLSHGFRGYWGATIFHPAQDTFAYSEPMPLLGVVAAPAFWLGASPALAHSLILLLCLVLNGLVTYLILRALKLLAAAAAAGGAIMLLLPYVHDQLGVLTLVPIAGVILTIHTLIVFASAPTTRNAAALGCAFGVAFLLNGQTALFLLLSTAPASVWLIRRDRVTRGALLRLGLAALVAAAFVAPVAIPQRRVAAEQGFHRTAERARYGSATLQTYARASEPPLLPLPPLYTGAHGSRALFPGIYKLLLALGAIFWIARRSHELRRVVAMLATLSIAAALLSMLPRAGWLWSPMRALVPGLDQLRSIWRAGAIAQVALALLAAIGIHLLITEWLNRPRAASATLGNRVRAAIIAVLAVAAAVELWPRQQTFAEAPSAQQWRPFVDWVLTNIPEDAALVHLPFASTTHVSKLEVEAKYMYIATWHHRPIANGYSSYWPRDYDDLRAATRHFPDTRSTRALDAAGIHFVVLKKPDSAYPVSPEWVPRFTEAAISIRVYERRHN